jgi:sigma54-dependent transcription regulator
VAQLEAQLAQQPATTTTTRRIDLNDRMQLEEVIAKQCKQCLVP